MCIIGFKCRSQWIDWSFWLFVRPVYSTTVWTTVFYLEVSGNHPATLVLKEWNPLPYIKEKINIWSEALHVLCLWLAVILGHVFFFNGLVTFTFLLFNHFRRKDEEGKFPLLISAENASLHLKMIQRTSWSLISYVVYLFLSKGETISLKIDWCWSLKKASTRFYCNMPQPSSALESS